MLNQEQATKLKALISKEAPELDVEIVGDEVEQNVFHLKVTTQYTMAIRSEEEWYDRKRLLTEK